ncbi:MAG TPA: gliding motility-associated C-terminal domain-containing protein, partial [Bacteroidia bacterium]
PYSGIIPSQRFIEYYAKDYSILIYDRWGNQVFSSGDINTQWDGTIKGKDASDGVYYWISSYVSRCDPNAQKMTNKGFVHLMR